MAIFFACHQDLDGTTKLLESYQRLLGSSQDAQYYAYRAKRFVSDAHPGASTKDMAYSRGVRVVSSYLQEATSSSELLQKIKSISYFKLSFEDKDIVPSLAQELDISLEDLVLFPFV